MIKTKFISGNDVDKRGTLVYRRVSEGCEAPIRTCGEKVNLTLTSWVHLLKRAASTVTPNLFSFFLRLQSTEKTKMLDWIYENLGLYIWDTINIDTEDHLLLYMLLSLGNSITLSY